MLLFSSFQPSFLLAASPFLYSPEHFALLSLFSLYPPGCPLLLPQIETPPLPAHAFPSYFNGLFCLLSFSDPTLSFLVFFFNPHFFAPPLVPVRRTTVLLRQDDSAVSIPNASSLHICAAFVPWQGRIWNGLLAASGRLMRNEVHGRNSRDLDALVGDKLNNTCYKRPILYSAYEM